MLYRIGVSYAAAYLNGNGHLFAYAGNDLAVDDGAFLRAVQVYDMQIFEPHPFEIFGYADRVLVINGFLRIIAHV
jgi:hypothetical protein